MKPSTILITIFAGLVAAAPAKNSNSQGTIEELQATFERNNRESILPNKALREIPHIKVHSERGFRQ